MLERSVPSQVNGTIFTEDSGIEIMIPFPKSKFQKSNTKKLL